MSPRSKKSAELKTLTTPIWDGILTRQRGIRKERKHTSLEEEDMKVDNGITQCGRPYSQITQAIVTDLICLERHYAINSIKCDIGLQGKVTDVVIDNSLLLLIRINTEEAQSLSTPKGLHRPRR